MNPAARGSAGIALISFVMASVLAVAAQSRPTEYQVKAAYLYNFGKFVSWPAADRGGDFGVCVLGADPFGATLDRTISSASINGKQVKASRISTPQAATDCRIVFIASSEGGRLEEDLGVLRKKGVLTVGDAPHFAQHGGMIQFVPEGDKVRFEVNLTAAQEAGLTLSSELLKVAIRVRGNQQAR